MTTQATPADVDPVYGSGMADHDGEIARAREAVQAEKDAFAAWERALDARKEAVTELYEAAVDDLSQNEMARTVGMEPSTFRSDLPAKRRRRRARSE